MGTRFLAVLAVMALGAGSAMVGLSMASGEWKVVGTGLEPGMGYALSLTDQADRLKLDLANLTGDAVATFSVYAPDGARAGTFSLNPATSTAEVVATPGVWTIFVYRAQGGDLTLSMHGAAGAGMFKPADVERREIVLGNVRGTQAVDNSYTAMVGREPVLANVHLQGSARNFFSELRTERGVVEVIRETELAASQGGAIVDARGERTTMPENLQAGPFTAAVKADSMSGTLVLVTLFVVAPEFDVAPPVVDHEEEQDEEDEEAEAEPAKPHRPHRHAPPAPPAKPREKPIEADYAECGTAVSRVPFGLEVDHGAVLRLTLGEPIDPWVTVYDPMDRVLAVVQLEEEGQSELVPLPDAGEYVIYSRGMDVSVEVLGAAECALRELSVEAISVALIEGSGLGSDSVEAPFSLSTPPLEFAVRMASPTTVGLDVRATFLAPDGEVGAEYQQIFGIGLLGGGEESLLGFALLPFGDERPRQHGGERGYAMVDATKLVEGDWLLQVDAEILEGELEAVALQYLREPVEEDEN